MDPTQLKRLKTQAHSLQPVVMIGDKGLTENVIKEAEIALQAHELIKVSIRGANRDDLKKMAEELIQACGAEMVQVVGHRVVLYKKRQD